MDQQLSALKVKQLRYYVIYLLRSSPFLPRHLSLHISVLFLDWNTERFKNVQSRQKLWHRYELAQLNNRQNNSD